MFGPYLLKKEALLTMQFHLIVRSFNLVKDRADC